MYEVNNMNYVCAEHGVLRRRNYWIRGRWIEDTFSICGNRSSVTSAKVAGCKSGTVYRTHYPSIRDFEDQTESSECSIKLRWLGNVGVVSHPFNLSVAPLLSGRTPSSWGETSRSCWAVALSSSQSSRLAFRGNCPPKSADFAMARMIQP